DLTVEPGEIRALLGENGAGKTTLMNVLYGLVQPDEGEIRVDGKAVTIRSPKDAIAARIGMVHQHFMLVPVFTVAENVTLGMERTRALGLLDRRRARRDVKALSERYGLDVDPDAYVEDLPVGVQQRVEIIKALLRDASVLVLDEPTAVLTPGETEDLFRIMRELRAGGRSIIFISHKLKEVQAIADTITVIRRGKVVGERPPGTTSVELASLMVGRSVQLRVSKGPARPGDVVLDVYDRPPYANGIALNLDAIRESAVRRVEEYDVRTTSVQTPAGTLSGGNQQKVVVAREMGRDVKALVVSQPTRGLDVGSIEF